jgi:hypothetical protein
MAYFAEHFMDIRDYLIVRLLIYFAIGYMHLGSFLANSGLVHISFVWVLIIIFYDKTGFAYFTICRRLRSRSISFLGAPSTTISKIGIIVSSESPRTPSPSFLDIQTSDAWS